MGVYEGRRTIDGLVVTIDGKKLDEHYEIKRFTRDTLAEAWAHAASFMGEYKCVIKMLNLSAVREHQLRGSKN